LRHRLHEEPDCQHGRIDTNHEAIIAVTDERALLAACEAGRAWMLDTIETLARIESPSDDKTAVDRAVDALADVGRALGARATRTAVADAGDHLSLEFGPPRAPGVPRLLLLGHLDTVWPIGTLATMPVARHDVVLTGPGVYDMKAGLVIGLQAVRALTAVGRLRASVRLLATSDEEIGSRTSRALLEAEAREADAVLVLEPGLESASPPLGGVKTGRKGVGEIRLEVMGVPAHAGVNPETGASAVHELVRQIAAIQALADPARGTTINAGVIGGGTRSNVVAERAWALIDVRVMAMDEARRLEDALRQLRPEDARITLTVTGGVTRPPLEPSEAGERLYQRAVVVARALGHDLPAGTVGGGSDGNFTAALGIPTIDGLGAVGAGAHARHEHVLIDALPLRAALLAGLIDRLSS
jgi:glutamate carboxypeptidase